MRKSMVRGCEGRQRGKGMVSQARGEMCVRHLLRFFHNAIGRGYG